VNTAPAVDPTAAPRPSSLRIWLLAARPATLPAALASVAVGIGAAAAAGGPLRIDTALGCAAVALLLQVLANFANDLSDFRRGADTPERTGPLRVAAAGLVTERQLEIAIAMTIGLAGIVGLWLAWVGGPVLIALGLLAVVAALAYTGGPFPYGYRALGEVFVFIFFGLVAVIGTAYLQVGRLESLFLAAALPPGALITAILVVNNLRDIPTDAAVGKRTLAVVLGERGTQVEYALLLAIAYAVPVALVVLWLAGAGPPASATPLAAALLLPLLTLPMAWPLLRTVRQFGERRELNLALKGTARLSLLHSLLFAVGLALAGFASGGAAG
jgi:1,4-dihydroxy-2-naphthoate polyprenyltransferase